MRNLKYLFSLLFLTVIILGGKVDYSVAGFSNTQSEQAYELKNDGDLIILVQKAKRKISDCVAQGGSPCGAQGCCLNGWRCGDSQCHPPDDGKDFDVRARDLRKLDR